MAKGLRSSVKKANRSRLRSKVFGPVEEARKQRLSAQLLSKAAEPSPNAKEDTMLLDDSATLPVKTNTTAANHNSSLRTESMNGEDEGTHPIHPSRGMIHVRANHASHAVEKRNLPWSSPYLEKGNHPGFGRDEGNEGNMIFLPNGSKFVAMNVQLRGVKD
ncbi:MAG: hypothetical protein Q9178_002230 [Gyalolechia marmorata]